MAGESRKQHLIDLLERGRTEEHSLWAQASDADREAPGEPEAWALKDLVAHLSEWKDRYATRLDAGRIGQTPETLTDFDAANAVIFEMHRGKSWAEVMELEARANARLVASVDAFGEESLFTPGLYAWAKGRSLAGVAADIGYQHPMEHLSGMLAERGDLTRAGAILARMVEDMHRIERSPQAYATNLYNLACFYSLHGMPEQALENLSKAFPLRPDLVDFSKEDSDLASLRDLPPLQAMYRGRHD